MQMPEIGHQLQPAPVHEAQEVPQSDWQFCERAIGSNSSARKRGSSGSESGEKSDFMANPGPGLSLKLL
jgi:hypothetical protein